MQRWWIATLPVFALMVTPVWAQQSSGGQNQQDQKQQMQQQQAQGQQKAQDSERQQAKMKAPQEVILEQQQDQVLAENILGATVYAAQSQEGMAAGGANQDKAKQDQAKQDQAQKQQQAQQGNQGAQSGTAQQAQMSSDQMGEEIGTIEDLIFDKEHKLTGVVLGVGGFLGIGQKSVGVAMDALTQQQGDGGEIYFTTNLNQEALENAPEFLTAEEQQDRTELRQVRAEQRDRGAVGGMQRQGTAAGNPDPAASGTGAGAGTLPSAQQGGQEQPKKQ